MNYAIKIDPSNSNKVVSLRQFSGKTPTDHVVINKAIYDAGLVAFENSLYLTYDTVNETFSPFAAANSEAQAIIERSKKIERFVEVKNSIDLRGVLNEPIPSDEQNRYDSLLAELSTAPPP